MPTIFKKNPSSFMLKIKIDPNSTKKNPKQKHTGCISSHLVFIHQRGEDHTRVLNNSTFNRVFTTRCV